MGADGGLIVLCVALSILFTLMFCFVFGFVTKTVMVKRGYSRKWFWWGFFFGAIALIVGLMKPDLSGKNPPESK